MRESDAFRELLFAELVRGLSAQMHALVKGLTLNCASSLDPSIASAVTAS